MKPVFRGVNPFENMRMAFSSLFQNRLRSALAALGIVIGVFAVTTMVSLGEMASAGVNKNLESLTGRTVMVYPNYDSNKVERVTTADIEALRRVGLTPVEQINGSASYEDILGKKRGVNLLGTIGDLPSIDPGFKLESGRYFSKQEWRDAQSVAVLSHTAANMLFPNGNSVGKRVTLFLANDNRVQIQVIGVQKALVGAFAGLANSPTIMVPYTFLRVSLPWVNRDEFDSLQVFVKPKENIDFVSRQVQQLFDSRYGAGAFKAESSLGFQNQLQSITGILQVLLGSIAGLSLLVGGIGIMNIMLVSVTERTREIGLRKAIGATSGQIRAQFMIEATALTVLGGATGAIFSLILLFIAVQLLPMYLPRFIVSSSTILLALSVSAATGLFFGVYPASQAAKLHPIDAMRYE